MSVSVRLLMEPGMRMTEDHRMEGIKVLRVWRIDPADRRVTNKTKPDVSLTEKTWPELLRGLADWIEQNDDNDLARLVNEWTKKAGGRG